TTAPNRHWISFTASEFTRSIKIGGCRISSEDGASFTIVRNYAAGNTDLTADSNLVRIAFEDTEFATISSPSGWRSPLVLYKMPNAISFTRCGGTPQYDGLVVADSSYPPPAATAET